MTYFQQKVKVKGQHLGHYSANCRNIAFLSFCLQSLQTSYQSWIIVQPRVCKTQTCCFTTSCNLTSSCKVPFILMTSWRASANFITILLEHVDVYTLPHSKVDKNTHDIHDICHKDETLIVFIFMGQTSKNTSINGMIKNISQMSHVTLLKIYIRSI